MLSIEFVVYESNREDFVWELSRVGGLNDLARPFNLTQRTRKDLQTACMRLDQAWL